MAGGTQSVVKRLFNSGEVSPKIYGRTDLDKWHGACKTLLNFVPLPQGGVQRRPGFEYIAPAKDNNNAVRLIPFQFSSTQAYIIEAGNSYFRFYMNGGQILHDNNAIVEVAHTFTENDLSFLQYTQSYDTLFITHRNHHPKQLTRTAHNNWTFGNVSFNNAPAEWSANNGYPRTCTFFQDRLIFGSSTLFPSRIWASRTGNYNDMTTGTNDSDGLLLNLLSGTSDVIYWLKSGKTVLAGLDTGVQSIQAGTASIAPLSPTNKLNKKESYFGTAEVMPVKLGEVVLYAGNPATKVRELVYSWEADAYQSGELTVLSDHLLENKTIAEMAYQQSPFEIVWCLRSDNTLIALTYMQMQKVVAWSRHNTNGNICSIATIPGNYETELWAAVHRNINGANRTYVERMSTFISKNLAQSDYVDAFYTYSGANTETIEGLGHLNGEQVQFVLNGNMGTGTVANNNLALGANGNYCRVGLNYTSDLEPILPEPDLQSGPLAFKTRRVVSMSISCRNSAGGTYGPDGNYQTELFANNALSNGKYEGFSVRGGHGIDRGILIRQADPLPMSIDLMGMELEVE